MASVLWCRVLDNIKFKKYLDFHFSNNIKGEWKKLETAKVSRPFCVPLLTLFCCLSTISMLINH